MNRFIAICGLNCEECDARKATVADDDTLRAVVAAQWLAQHMNSPISLDDVNCTGCREDGVKFVSCRTCAIRNCASEKGFDSCSDCPEFIHCQTLAVVLKSLPESVTNKKRDKQK